MNLMDLFIKIGIKDEASGPIKKLTGAVAGGLKTAAKIGTVSIGAATTAIGTLVAQSVKAYGEYEQLVGGVETLFKESAEEVQKYAANAYKTAGLSSNQYMETVTSFSASLLQSLGGDTKEAANVADMAITDMADNANKMGTSMEAIQNAYQGFAKQNYTMLDNLKLGYGGTKSEMERLLADAEKLTGVKYNISNLSDVYKAIHAIQTEMGIAGTTAKEAASTIQGSFGMLKSSWANLLVGLGDPEADLNALFDNVISSAETALENIVPVVGRALSGIGTVIKGLAPIIRKELPGLISSALPDLLSAASDLISGLAESLPGLLSTTIENIPDIVASVISIVEQIVNAVSEAVPQLLETVWASVDGAISNSNFGERWASIKEAVSTAVDGIKQKWDELKEKLQPLIDKVQEAVDNFVAWEEENHVLETAISAIGTAISGVIGFIGDCVAAFNNLLEAGVNAARAISAAFGFVSNPVGSTFDLFGNIRSANDTAIALNRRRAAGNAIGNDYVPYNNYPAMLHRGEAVLTAREADMWRRGTGTGEIVNNWNFYGVSQSDLDMIVEYVNRELA